MNPIYLLQVLLVISFNVYSNCLPIGEDVINSTSSSSTTTLESSTQTQPTNLNNISTTSQNSSNQTDMNGNSTLFQGDSSLAQIINHSKLFTEFVSFAVNPTRTGQVLDSIQNNLSADLKLKTESKDDSNVTLKLGEQENDSAGSDKIKSLFVEMMRRNSPGIIVSFDYLNITEKSFGVETMSRKPVRMWGIIPDEKGNSTTYFISDYFSAETAQRDTKATAKEQIDDFELWKNEAESRLGEFTDDKLGDGTIGSLLGG